jgi:isopentenyldiphosphate isomerase
MEEVFPLVDLEGNVVGKATRKECHTGTFYLHPVVHLHVFNKEGSLFMQKRSEDKDIQPGKWDTSVGGHVDFGEKFEDALYREASEELGIIRFEPFYAFRYDYRSDKEYELVNTFITFYDGIIVPDHKEIAEGRFWEVQEILSNIGKGVFTPNFEHEIEKVLIFFNSLKRL